MSLECYCNSGLLHADCCEPFLTGARIPPSPEALMRSRYSAFCTANVAYLVNTRLPEKRGIDEAQRIRTTAENTQWIKLEVVSSHETGNNGVVEFAAFYRDARGAGQLYERSAFLRQGNQWFYVDGTHLPVKKPQRNDPCWCGSGKKFKKCCGC